MTAAIGTCFYRDPPAPPTNPYGCDGDCDDDDCAALLCLLERWLVGADSIRRAGAWHAIHAAEIHGVITARQASRLYRATR